MATPIKIGNKTNDKIFVFTTDQEVMELEPQKWRQIDTKLTERELKVLEPYFQNGELAYSEHKTATDFGSLSEYKPEEEKIANSKVWTLKKVTIKLGSDNTIKVGETKSLTASDLKGIEAGKSNEEAYPGTYRLIKLTTDDPTKLHVNAKNFTVRALAEGTANIEVEVEALGNNTGVVKTDKIEITINQADS